MKIREFNHESDADYAAGVAVWNAEWPDYPETIEEWKGWYNTRNKDLFFERLLTEIDGQIVCCGYWGEPSWSDFAGKYEWDFHIHPDYEYDPIATQMYDCIMAKINERTPTKLSTFSRTDKTQYIDFITARGYKLAQTEPCSLLDVTAFDPAAFQDAVDKVADSGIKMYVVTELKKSDPQWKEKLYELTWEISKDVPSTDPVKKTPFEVYSAKLDDPIVTPLHTRYVAVDTTKASENDLGSYTALSNLSYNRVNKTRGHTGLTGVARAYRRKGIATAIKVHALNRAKADGIEVIDTGNDENNPMLDLNIRLGFKPGPAWVDYELIVEK